MITTTYQSITIPAYQVVPKAWSGSFFFCLSATGQFMVSFDGSAYMEMG